MKRMLGTLALAAAMTIAAGGASANGRFPESNALFFAPNDPDTILLRVTFGLIVSRDRGKTWDWVCEGSLGTAGVEDPMYAVTPDGTLIASTFQGLILSRDRGCSFAFVGGDLQDRVFIDVAARPGDRGNVLALASGFDGRTDAGEPFFKSTIFETKDQGTTFAALGANFDPTLLSETIDFTTTGPARIYVSAVRSPEGSASASLLTSRDYAKTWEENVVPLEQGERAAYIAAVDPTNADRVYLRTRASVDKPSRIVVTDDAGKTFRTVFTGQGALAGFALSLDGSKLWVGSIKDGLHVASTTDFAFTQRSKVAIQCLAMTTDGLWACSNEKSGFVAGLSTDEGASFESKLHFCDIRGALACPPGTSTNLQCAPSAPSLSAALGCGGVGDAGPDGGSPAESRSGGDEGCAMHAPTSAPFFASFAGLLAAGAMILRRRRR